MHFNLDETTLKDYNTVVYHVVYVDDLLIIGNNEAYNAFIKK